MSSQPQQIHLPATMDELLTVVINVANAPSDEKPINLLKYLANIPAAVLLLPLNSNADPLLHIDWRGPKEFIWLGIFILTARLVPASPYYPPFQVLWSMAESNPEAWGSSLIPQINYIAENAVRIWKKTAAAVHLPGILNLLLRGLTNGRYGVLTSIHPLFLESCLITKQYHIALPAITYDIHTILKDNFGLHASHVLGYFYLSGMIFSALRKWAEAKIAFVTAISSVPAHTGSASALQVAAWKRLGFVSILHDGEQTNLPKYTSSGVSKAIKSADPIYQSFFTAWERSDFNTVLDIASKNETTFVNDATFGLVKHVLLKIDEAKILNLTKVYSKTSINDLVIMVKGGNKGDVAHPTAVLKVKKTLLKMIDEQALNATLTPDSITFSPLSSLKHFSDADTISLLKHKTSLATRVATEFWEKDRDYGKSDKFLKKANELGLAGMTGGGAGWGPAGMIGDDFDAGFSGMEGIGGGSSDGPRKSRNMYEDNY